MSKLEDAIRAFNQEINKNTKKEIKQFNKHHKYLYKTGTLFRKNSKRYRQFMKFKRSEEEKFDF